jgi:GTP-binding protein HflX
MKGTSEKKRFLLVSIIPQNISQDDIFQELQELKYLVESYKGVVVDVVLQKREVHDKGQYIGAGKIDEAAKLIIEKDIDVVVLNAVVIPGHIHDIKSVLVKANPQIEVWDRIDLILEIFSLHAKTAESRLQIELAGMRHMGPRIYGMGMVLSRQAGGIGGRGIGETNTERMKRHWRDQVKITEGKLQKLAQEREKQLIRREKNGVVTVSIVGYTNAGKTTLFNLLTGKKKYAKNELFATLDSATGRTYLPGLKQEILISDTIGFIQNLPANLIDAFKSTLMEAIHADVLLHVIDSGDPYMQKKIAVVEQVLREVGIDKKPIVYVFSKIDTIDSSMIQALREQYASFTPQFISLKAVHGVTELIHEIEYRLHS